MRGLHPKDGLWDPPHPQPDAFCEPRLPLTQFPFSRRSYTDSCFLDPPLYPELADVQWYGQEKAKPGTLV